MSSGLQEREKRAYDVLSGNRGQRKGSYQRFLRGGAASPKAQAEKPVEESPKRHWTELLGTLELSDRVLAIYNLDCEPEDEDVPAVAEEAEVQWSVPNQFKAPAPVTDGHKIDMNTIVMNSITSMAPPAQAEPMPANGNAMSNNLPMMQLQMLALRPKT